MKKIEQEKNRPAANLPYQTISKPFRCQYIIPLDESIEIQQDANGVCYLRAKGGSLDSLVAGDNIRLDRREDGSTVISSVNTDREIYGGQNVVVSIDPDTGAAVISAFYDGTIDDEHYKGIFKDTEELMAAVPEPVQGDYALVRDITITDGESTWNGRYKLAFYDSGLWQIVDQMMTFTNNPELLKLCWSVGGSSPVIYLSKVAGSGNFWDLLNIPIVATPVATVIGNTITVTCETEGAEIWYSTDGSMPHVNGTKYTVPITASQSATYRFVGIKNGMINSLEAVVSAGYSLEAPAITLDWTTGEVSMANPNASGEIRYTLDGSEPDENSLLYSVPIFPAPPVGYLRTVIKAIVYDSGSDSTSSVTESVIDKALLAGNTAIQAVSGSWRERWYVMNEQYRTADGSEVHYTTDHTTPDYQSNKETDWLSFNRYGSENPVQLKLIGFRPGYFPSDIKTRNIGYEKPTAPNIAFDALTDTVTLSRAGNVLASPEIPLKTDNSNPTDGCRIYYTLDGSTPTDQSTLYTAPFQISENVTVKAVLIAYGQYYSDVASEEISIVAAPVITLDSEVGDISITGPAGATIYYTRDGSTPTLESTRYTMPINVMNSAHEEIRAIAVLSGRSSAMTVAEFQGLSWRDNGSVDVNYTSGVVTISPKIAADGATLSYGIGSNGGYPGSYYVYSNPVTLRLFDTDGKRVFFKQQKYGYIPNIYEADFTSQVSVDDPEIIYDENTGKATIALDGNTSEIPLYTTTNLPALGARIYYTTDGTTPSADNGTMYDGVSEIPVSVGETLKAMTECYGEYDSEVNEWARTPKISVDSMTGLMTIINPYGSQTRYTLDGSTPTRYSTLYSEPVDVSVYTGIGRQYLTIKAAAFENDVAIAVSELTMPVVAIETIGMASIGPGVDDGISVEAYISGVDDVSIFTSKWFRTGGGLPDASGLIETWNQAGTKAYRSEVFDTISAFGHSTQVQYLTRFCQDGHIPVYSAPLLIGFDTPDAPSINYNDTAMTATFARTGNTAYIPLKTDNINPEQGCRIYYTLDGSTPTDQSTLWDGNAVQCQAGDLIKAICVCYGQYASEVTTEEIPLKYMYLEAVQAGSTVSMISKLATAPDLEYSTDGRTWNEWGHTTADGVHVFDTITLSEVGDKVYIRGDNPNGLATDDTTNFSNFILTGSFNGGGNIMSLLDVDMEQTVVPPFGFFRLFAPFGGNNSALVTPPEMDTITTIGDSGCSSMYNGCTSLTAAADMPNVTTIGDYGCSSMYFGCTSLTAAADMPNVTTIGDYGCMSMYGFCTSLTAAADMPNVTTIGYFSCSSMYGDCTSLTAAADMPNVTTIGDYGCSSMYSGCTSLTTAADMSNVITIGDYGCDSMYGDCTSLTAAADMPNVTTIDNNGCSSMYFGCTFMMSNDGGQTLNFEFPSLPITAGYTTYSTPLAVGQWMGNENGLTNP